jgi:UDP-N-acetylglucosamine 2-epimerase (non-hydrolysing)
MMKVIIVFGTRPEAIKLAPIIKEFEKHPDEIQLKVCVTAQHRQMLDSVLKMFDIKPDYDLNIMRDKQTLFDITNNVLAKIKEIYFKEQPDIVFVQGDTTTTFASALAAYYLQIKVAHIEAGLRTYNKYAPFPEEINRRMVSAIADLHFAPTEQSKLNLLKENVNERDIFVTGNTVIDALFMILEKIKGKHISIEGIESSELENKRLILVTGHRRESFGEGFENICNALKELAESFDDIIIIYPVHLNPNVRGPVNRILGNVRNVKLIEPIGYQSFVYLMEKAYVIITDSGGIQEEAPSLSKPVLVMREITERPEAVEAGTVKVVGTQKESIVNSTRQLLLDANEYKKMSSTINPYGDGKSAQRTYKILIERFGKM